MDFYKQRKHNFHLVIKNNLKDKIINLGKKLNLNISNTAIYILEKAICILNRYQEHSEITDDISKYQFIDWDKDIHIYMEEDLYRKIKHLADTSYAFSMATVIRKLFEFYFYILDLSKGEIERVNRVFKRFYLIYVKKSRNNKIFNKKNLNQEQLLGDLYYYLEFNDKFVITGIKFVKTD